MVIGSMVMDLPVKSTSSPAILGKADQSTYMFLWEGYWKDQCQAVLGLGNYRLLIRSSSCWEQAVKAMSSQILTQPLASRMQQN